MKLLSGLLLPAVTFSASDFVTTERFVSVPGIACPTDDTDDTTDAVKAAFNLVKSPNSGSEWISGECNDGTGDIRVFHLPKKKTNTGFYWQVESDVGIDQPEELTLKYDFKVMDGFDFVKGGKLPGLFGGQTSCNGGANAADLGCYSTRLMWRAGGDAELYLYAPYDQSDGFCERENYHCNFDKGHSVNRGCFVIQPGQWHQIEERVKLNTPGKRDGVFMLFNNGERVLHLTDVNYREDASIKIMGVHFNTFYGGSDSSWYPQALMSADFKNFALDAYSDSPLPSDVADNCVDVQCAEHAICKSSYRQFECVCQSGYKGDGKTACVATGTTVETTDKPASQGCNSVDIGLTCSPSQMTFTVPDCFFTDRNIDPMTVHIGQTSGMDECSGVSDPAMTGDWLFSIDTNKCDIETSSNDTHIWYKGQLKTGLAKSANSVITRVAKRFELDLRCELAKSVGITMHEYFVPLVSSETVKVDTVASSASFQVDMSLFIDSAFTTPIGVGHEIQIPDPIFTKLELKEAGAQDKFTIKIAKCWATPTSDADDAVNYVFIDNYQVAEGENDEVTLSDNCAGSNGAFSVNSFSFGADNAEVYFHCDIDICDNTEDCSCSAIVARKRRSVRDDEGTVKLSIGPVGCR